MSRFKMLFLSLVAALFAAPSWAATCAPITAITAAAVKAGQILQWSGAAPNNTDSYVIMAHPRTGAWTALYVGSKGIACVLAEGRESKPVFGEPI